MTEHDARRAERAGGPAGHGGAGYGGDTEHTRRTGEAGHTGKTDNTNNTCEAGDAGNTEYRIAHAWERLAREDIAELGMRFETRGGTVLVTGTAPTARCRDTIMRVLREELADLRVRTDITVAEVTAPDHPEELA